MAYNFGQFRKEQYTYSNFVKQISKNEYTLASVVTKIDGFSGISFSDVCIKKSFSPNDGSLFLRVAFTRFTRETGVTVKLMKENTSALATTNSQTVASLLVPAGRTVEELSTPVMFDILITPNDAYTQIVFAIDRDGQDFTETPRKWIPTRDFMVDSFGSISNIIPSLDIGQRAKLKQIGIQSRPGLPICVNGEMIRVGRSGIYEINHGIDITFVGFMPEEKDHFLMDYQY